MAKRLRGWQLEMESRRQVARKGKALEGVWKVGGDRLEGHPMCSVKHWKQKSIP